MLTRATDPIRDVRNQPAVLENYDAFSTDRPLAEAVAREGARWANDVLSSAAREFTSTRVLELGRLANDNPPVLHTHDRRGQRLDTVEFHPAWHALLALSVGKGLVSMPWTDERPGSPVVRAALFYLYAQAEAGTECPIAMSFGAVPVLRRVEARVEAVRELWLPKLLSGEYDPRFIPAPDKRGVLFGMGMTERQGGSDVRSNITRAEPLARRGEGERYAISGHKWFMSAPMCDAFLVTAQAEGGVSCFLVPRFLDDGSKNTLYFQRLKNKLGNRSNASSEVEFHAAQGILIGDEGRGVPTIIEMASHTRLDCVLATGGMQRRALAVALNHASRREAFGARLIDKPLMRNVLADLALEAEATTTLALYLARCFDPASPEADRLVGRLLTPAAKLHACKRGAQFAAEAMEVLGGNGYVEDTDLARIYRELPLLSIWEGSGNVMCLDALRVMAREPDAVAAFRERIAAATGANAAYDAFVGRLEALFAKPGEARGRRIAHGIALAAQAALLLEHAPASVAAAFCNTRLDPARDWGMSFGTLPDDVPIDAILDRAGCADA